MRRVLLLLTASLALVVSAFAQERTVTGKVTSAEDGSALPGVNVVLKGTTTGTVTDVDGNYRIAVPSEGGTLVFSFIGLTTSEVGIGSRSTVDMQMASDVTQLSEVVVVAYGTQEKKNITGSISSVKSDAFKNQPVIGVDQAMQGRVAGVQVTQNSGTPGGGIAVRVRGASSLSASNEPLYVVDGIPINTGSYSQIGVGNQQVSALNDINPSDIESIEVLKDAASASLYGSRAANGVVMITTKRGKAQKTQINFNMYMGSQQAWNKLAPVTGEQYVGYLTESLVNRFGVGTGTVASPQGAVNADGTLTVTAANAGLAGGNTPITFASPSHFAARFWRYTVGGQATVLAAPGTSGFYEATRNPAVNGGNPLEVRDLDFFLNPASAPSTNWIDQVFQTAPIANYELSFTGGNENTKFLVSGSYFDQEGIIIGSGFDRASFRANIDNKVSDKFKFGTSTAFNRSRNRRINNDNNIYGVLSTAVLTASDVPAYLESGAYGFDPSNSTDNPLAQAYEPTNEAVSNRLLSNLYGEYFFNDKFSFKTSLGLDFLYFREDQFIPTTTRQGQPNGVGNANTSQELNWINENVVRYNNTFAEDHNVDVLVGASFQESSQNTTLAAATGFPSNTVTNLSAGSTKTNASSTGTSWALVSYFARANYSYKGKYLLTATVRTDGSSRFGSNYQYGTFPSMSAGWNVHEESFMSNLSFLSNLKLRASYGITGNQEFGNFSYAGLFGVGANYNLAGGFNPTQIANPDLSWESTAQTDIGLEVGLFDKVNLTVDYFQKNTSDLLLNRPILAVSGFTTYAQNIGEMQNKGLELAINATPISTTSGLTWTTDFNIAIIRNEVKKLADDVLPFAAGFASWVEEGRPLGTFRGYRVEGILQTPEEITALNAAAVAATGNANAVYQSALTRPGDIKFVDLNGDGVITSDDQEILGDANPDFLGGWSNTLTYKGFDFNFLFQYVVGNDVWNHTRVFAEGANSIFGLLDSSLDRWSPSNTTSENPRWVNGDPNNNRRNSDRWIEDGSFIRLKNISLGYTLPNSLVKKAGFSRVRVYASSQNLLTFTNYSGFDPEVNTFSGSNTALGTDFLTYPQAKTYTFGINASF